MLPARASPVLQGKRPNGTMTIVQSLSGAFSPILEFFTLGGAERAIRAYAPPSTRSSASTPKPAPVASRRAAG